VTQHLQNALPVGVILIDGLAAIAARGHVVESAGEFDADGTSHLGRLPEGLYKF
jgi:hypothetical protein